MGAAGLAHVRDMGEGQPRRIVVACAAEIDAETQWREIEAEGTRIKGGG